MNATTARYGVALITISAGVAAQAASAAGVTLARDGQPVATILIASNATRVAQFAAFELQAHVRQISGATLPILTDAASALPTGARILVGESAATRALGLPGKPFEPQEYLVKSLPETLILMGCDADQREAVRYDWERDPGAAATWPGMWDEQGTLHAVYDLLERDLGVRWFGYSEVGSVLPSRPTLTVQPAAVRRAPGFRYRYASWWPNGNYDRYVSLQPRKEADWRRFEETAFAALHRRFPEARRYEAAKDVWIRLFRTRSREGGELCLGNHSLYGYYDRFWERSADPERAALFEGRRAEWFAQGQEGTPLQMCYSSTGLVARVAQDARDFFDGKGKRIGEVADGRFFAVEPMDNSSFCRCERCQKWVREGGGAVPDGFYSTDRYSDYFFQFVNAVAREVRKTHPHKWIVTLAYQSHAFPPRTFTLETNVLVQFCFAANRAPYATDTYRNDLRALHLWADEARRSRRPLYLWLYYTFPVEIAVNGRFHCFPGFFAHAIGEQFALFHKLGYSGAFHCGYGQEVETYVTYRLMDDPTRNVDDLLDDYFTGYYGAAAAPMRALYDEIEKTYCTTANYGANARPAQNAQIAWGQLGTPARMARFGALMQQARVCAATDVEKQRVAIFERGTWDYMVEGFTQYTNRMSRPIPTLHAPRVAAAGGDAARIDWATAAPLGGPWYQRGEDQPAARRLEGRIAHDGAFVYIELADPCASKDLYVSDAVFPCDDWELFVAAQRGLPYRQYAVSPSARMVALSHGEVNGRMNVDMDAVPAKAISDLSRPDRWVTRLAFPMSDIVPGGTRPGGRIYLNVVRVSSGMIASQGCYIDSWIPFCTVHDTDRLAEIILE